MRSAIVVLVLPAFLTLACDGSSATDASPAGGSPRFATSSNSGSSNLATVSVISKRYFTEQESFPLCDGGVAVGDINWHELILAVTTPDGVTRRIDELNMTNGARAIGPDGTEYTVQQINMGQSLWSSGAPTQYLKNSLRLMVISPGSGPNLFLTRNEDGTYSTECRG